MLDYKLAIVLGLVELIITGCVGTILVLVPGGCSTPLRLWLECLFVMLLSHFCILSVTEFLAPNCSKSAKQAASAFLGFYNIILSVFTVVWFVYGNYWYYTADDSCIHTFYEGYVAISIVLVTYYVFIGVACCLGCTMVILALVGRGLTTLGSSY